MDAQVEIHIRPSMRIVSMQLFNGGKDIEAILHCVRVLLVYLYVNVCYEALVEAYNVFLSHTSTGKRVFKKERVIKGMRNLLYRLTIELYFIH